MPREKTETKTVYTLDELDGSARERALEKLAQWATEDSFWYESVIEDAKECGAILGIQIDDIFFSGFWSQGDGACFTGRYEYFKGSAGKIRQHAPNDTELHRIADTLQAIERRNFYRLTATISKRSHYYSHENTVAVDTDTAHVAGDDGDTGALAVTLRDFMRWIYRRLEDEFTYRTSEEQLLEDAAANGWEFDEHGNLA